MVSDYSKFFHEGKSDCRAELRPLYERIINVQLKAYKDEKKDSSYGRLTGAITSGFQRIESSLKSLLGKENSRGNLESIPQSEKKGDNIREDKAEEEEDKMQSFDDLI